jgi:aryl-alcohol dehydrogenase-like predicted oxidoreductase
MTVRAVPDPSSRRPLGRTALSVSPLCVGCAPLGNMPETFEYSVSKQQAFDTLRTVFESPLNFLDTAASYGDGESERRVGRLLAEMGASQTLGLAAHPIPDELWSTLDSLASPDG